MATKTTLSELLAQKAALDKQISDVQREERTDAVAKVKSMMSEYGLTLADIGSRAAAAPGKNKGSGSKVAAKYRDAATGESWSGRGLKPKWLTAALANGRSIDEFTV